MDAKKKLAGFRIEHASQGAGAPPTPKNQPHQRKPPGKRRRRVRDDAGSEEFVPEVVHQSPQRPAPPPARVAPGGPEESSSEETVDVGFIHAHRPSTRVVREFMRVQAASVSAAEEDDFL